MGDDLLPSFDNIDVAKKNVAEEALGLAVSELIGLLKETTEFSNQELKSISILLTDKHMSQFLKFYILNKKHIQRKFVKEILHALDSVMNALSRLSQVNQLPQGVTK